MEYNNTLYKIIENEKLKNKVIKTIKNNYQNFCEEQFLSIIKNNDEILSTLIKELPIKFYKQKEFNPDRYENIIKNIKIINPDVKKYLDIGCSDASLTNVFRKGLKVKKKNIFLVDKVEPQNKKCPHNKFFSDIKYIEDSSMDLVTCMMVLHHVKDYKQIIKEIYRVLRPGGIFLIREAHNKAEEDILYHSIMDIIYYQWHNQCEYNSDYNYRSKDYWIKLINSNQFNLVKYEYKEKENYFKPFQAYFMK